MIDTLIDNLGTRNIARACGVSPACVTRWKYYGLPNRTGRVQGRRTHYEKVLAKMAGMKVKELRQALAEKEQEVA
jgi:hypothetical protein